MHNESKATLVTPGRDSTAILGISAFYHDSAAALLVDGEIVAAAQEERFSRKKHDERFPVRAIDYCLEEAGVGPEQLDYVGFYDKPALKFERLLETYFAYAPAGFPSFLRAMPVWLKRKLHLPREMRAALKGAYESRFVFTEHHESHAASAFFPSPFEEAAILTLDGVGEWATASCGVGRDNRIELAQEMHFPHSLGLLYSAFTYYCGFAVNNGEYKLMGLAPYGRPTYRDLILDRLIDLKEDGSFRLDMSYFNYCQGLTMTSEKFHRLFGAPPRRPEASTEGLYVNLAASIQKVTEEVMLRCAGHLQRTTGMKNLCLAGGVALNCVGNGRILREGPFENIWIQPAAGDAGGALGVAQFIWHQLLDKPRRPQPTDGQKGSLLGVEFDDSEVESFLATVDADWQHFADDKALCEHVAAAIAEGQIVSWFQGRMEFGPRALGSRSILGDARDPRMQSLINQKVKFREGFRPFAPVVLAEHAHEFFEMKVGHESPYMLLVAPVDESRRLPIPPELQNAQGLEKLLQKRSQIPSVTHVDYSARVQTVDPLRHGLLRTLMETFQRQTGCPVMVNTSFNLGWDPIVCSPGDAYRTFMSSDIDVLCLGRFVLQKSLQPAVVRSAAARLDPAASSSALRSPCCRAPLADRGHELSCAECGQAFPVTDGIPQLFWPEDDSRVNETTEIVKSFYEETPFPNYDDHDSVRSLIEKSRRSGYARRLDESIPYNSTVLEVGCGTGQMSNFLGIGCRQVLATDICMNSLRLGETFRREHDLERVSFLQMNLFRPALEPEAFDMVLCNGVLHHTPAPQRGFEELVKLVRPGGHIIIGLYNRYGRLLTDLRRQVFRVTGGRLRAIDPVLRQAGLSEGKRRAWFADQYRHPHESKHTFGEVLAWFDRSGLEFVRGLPAMRSTDDGLAGASLFEPQPRGGALDHLLAQLTEIVSPGQKEGGFFVMIARKPGGEPRERSVVAAPSQQVEVELRPSVVS
ncbi:MAG: methyltransferase domain-containing protein [bacterium]|nr:methyltransferase domain-containing protein [bacterium]